MFNLQPPTPSSFRRYQSTILVSAIVLLLAFINYHEQQQQQQLLLIDYSSSSSNSNSYNKSYNNNRPSFGMDGDRLVPRTSAAAVITAVEPSTGTNAKGGGGAGYFNLSCPFEMSKFSCSYMHRGVQRETVHASMEYYRQIQDMIEATFRRVVHEYDGTAVFQTESKQHTRTRRILMTGDSLMRQLFISIACNAHSILPNNNLIADAIIPWQDSWPISYGPNKFPSIGRGVHGGFGSASIRLVNGIEIHFVPHRGANDPTTGEMDILERMNRDIHTYNGRITFGEKTAMPLSVNEHVDVLVFNVGIHYGLGQSKSMINHFIHWIAKPLMMMGKHPNNNYYNNNNNNNNNKILHDGFEERNPDTSILEERPRTRIIYVTTPSQHYNTSDGQWEMKMTVQTLKCVDKIQYNPRAQQEKKMLRPGINVDVLLDYDDLNLGSMHMQHGDCSHYCMPGVPDGVATRLLQELLS